MRRNRSGMSRRRFIGTGAAGLAAAGMYGSGVAFAGGNQGQNNNNQEGMIANVGIVYRNNSGSYAPGKDVAIYVLQELGIDVDPVGHSIEGQGGDIDTLESYLLDGGYNAVMSFATSDQTVVLADAITKIYNQGGPLIFHTAINGSLSGLNRDDAFFRLKPTAFDWGAYAHLVADEAWPDKPWGSNIVFLLYHFWVDDPEHPEGGYWKEDPFGSDSRDGFEGVTNTLTMEKYGTDASEALSTLDTTKTWLVGAALRQQGGTPPDSNCNEVVQAVRELNAENGSDYIYLTSIGTVNSQAYYDMVNWQYTQDPDSPVIGSVPDYWRGLEYQAFINWYNAWPGKASSWNHHLYRAFDSAMLLGAGILRSRISRPVEMRNKIISFSDGMGPLAFFDKLMTGGDLTEINYQGASGPCDLTPNGEMVPETIIWEIWA